MIIIYSVAVVIQGLPAVVLVSTIHFVSCLFPLYSCDDAISFGNGYAGRMARTVVYASQSPSARGSDVSALSNTMEFMLLSTIDAFFHEDAINYRKIVAKETRRFKKKYLERMKHIVRQHAMKKRRQSAMKKRSASSASMRKP